METNKTIHILDANYGRLSLDLCVPPGGIGYNITDCRYPDSTEILRNKCDGRVSCELNATTDEFGEDCRGVYKYLGVTYECVQSGRFPYFLSKCKFMVTYCAHSP